MCVEHIDGNVYYDSIFKILPVKTVAFQNATTIGLLTAAAIGVVVVALVSAALVTNRTITSTGSIKAIGVSIFNDPQLTNQTTSIDWGLLTPNSTTNYTIYVANNGTIPVTLSIAFSNWNPVGAATYISPSWNCTGYRLNSGSYVAARLAMTVLANITGVTTFSLDIAITGTE